MLRGRLTNPPAKLTDSPIHRLIEAERTVTRHYEGSLIPNFEGTELKMSVSVSGDELTLVGLNPNPALGFARDRPHRVSLPQARLEYYPGYYATWVFDPDGHDIEVVHKS